ncbi:hypothetical protein [Aliikangiella maris]|uniref:Uncharacterized protein n=2 Tax=Aliikangiella maris TaxID=3162458 RepID=A0ABV3MKK7_9GAMM
MNYRQVNKLTIRAPDTAQANALRVKLTDALATASLPRLSSFSLIIVKQLILDKVAKNFGVTQISYHIDQQSLKLFPQDISWPNIDYSSVECVKFADDIVPFEILLRASCHQKKLTAWYWKSIFKPHWQPDFSTEEMLNFCMLQLVKRENALHAMGRVFESLLEHQTVQNLWAHLKTESVKQWMDKYNQQHSPIDFNPDYQLASRPLTLLANLLSKMQANDDMLSTNNFTTQMIKLKHQINQQLSSQFSTSWCKLFSGLMPRCLMTDERLNWLCIMASQRVSHISVCYIAQQLKSSLATWRVIDFYLASNTSQETGGIYKMDVSQQQEAIHLLQRLENKPDWYELDLLKDKVTGHIITEKNTHRSDKYYPNNDFIKQNMSHRECDQIKMSSHDSQSDHSLGNSSNKIEPGHDQIAWPQVQEAIIDSDNQYQNSSISLPNQSTTHELKGIVSNKENRAPSYHYSGLDNRDKKPLYIAIEKNFTDGMPKSTEFAGLPLLIQIMNQLSMGTFIEKYPMLYWLPGAIIHYFSRHLSIDSIDPAIAWFNTEHLYFQRQSPQTQSIEPILLQTDYIYALPKLWRQVIKEQPLSTTASGQQIMYHWIKNILFSIRQKLGKSAKWLIKRQGKIAFTQTHVDVLYDFSQLNLAIRLAGFDINPGWVNWLGKVVTIHYQD